MQAPDMVQDSRPFPSIPAELCAKAPRPYVRFRRLMGKLDLLANACCARQGDPTMYTWAAPILYPQYLAAGAGEKICTHHSLTIVLTYNAL